MTEQEEHESTLLDIGNAIYRHGVGEWLKWRLMEDYMGNPHRAPALELTDLIMARAERDGALRKEAVFEEINRCLVRLPVAGSQGEAWRMPSDVFREFLIFLRERHGKTLRDRTP